MLVPFQREIARFDQLQPFRLVHAGLGKLRHPVGDHQFGGWQRLAFHLFIEHVQMVLVHMGVADEVGEPARRVTGQAAHQRQKRGAFGEVERRAEAVPPPYLLHITYSHNAFKAFYYVCIIAFAQCAIKLLLKQNQKIEINPRPRLKMSPLPSSLNARSANPPTLVAKW